MAAYTDLPTAWQTELEKKIGAAPYLELIYDPEGMNLSLTGKYSVVEVSAIKNARDIDPVWGARSSIPEITIICHDPDDYLNPENANSPFHNAAGVLYAQALAGQKTITIEPDNISFSIGEDLTINDGTNSETVTVATFVSGSTYHTITAAANLGHSYAAGTAIFTSATEYKDMMLRMRFSGLTNWVTLFWGKLLRILHHSGRAELTVTDRRKLKLDQTLVQADSSAAKKLKWINTTGALADSVTWNSGSAGCLDRTKVTVKDACRLGRWTFTFDTGMTYTVSGPGVEGESGSIALDDITGLTKTSATTGLNGASDVFVAGSYAYVVSRLDDSLRIYDVSAPGSPVLKSTTTDATNLNGPTGIKIVGNYAYICTYDGYGVVIYDVSDKTSPVRKGTLTGQTNLNGAEDIDIVGNYAYVAASVADSLSIYDVSNVNSIIEKSTITGVGSPNHLDGACAVRVVGNYAYVASRVDQALTIFNVANPTDPVHVGEITGPGNYLTYAQGVDVVGNYAYVCGGGDDALVIIDVTTPSAPTRTGQVQDITNLDGTRDVKVLGDYAYITCEDGDCISVVNVSNKTSPTYVTKLSGAGSPNYLDQARGIYVQGIYAYATAYTDDSLVIAEIAATTANDYDNDQITVPVDAWSGTINDGDKVVFCTGISWESANPIQCIYDFLTIQVGLENKYIDCSSYFGAKKIGTLYEAVNAGATTIKVAVTVPTRIKTYETLTITEGATSENVVVATGVTINNSYPPYIQLTVSALANSFTTAAIVTWKQRGSLDTDFSFDNEYDYCSDNSIVISLTLERDMSKLQALELLASHFDGFVFQDNWGREKAHSYRTRTTTPGTVAYNTNLKLPDPELELKEIINKFRFQYGYDYVNDKYLYEMVYPETDATNRSYLRYGFIREETMKLPGIFNSAIINLIKANKFLMWENGINIIRFSMTLQGLVAMIGDHFDFTSLYPDLETEIEILGIEGLTVTGKIDILLAAWDYGKVFG